MQEAFIKSIPLALAAAINPFGIIIIFYLMAKPNKPIQRAWLFLLGATSVLVLLIFIAEPILKNTLGKSLHQNSTSAIIDIIIAIILIFLAIFHKRKSNTNESQEKSLWQIFFEGMAFMALLDLESTVFFLAVIKTIFDAHLNVEQNLIIFVVDLIIAMSTMAFPVFLATILPKQSEKFLSWLNKFMIKHGTFIGKIVVVAIAIYLLYDGLSYFYL